MNVAEEGGYFCGDVIYEANYAVLSRHVLALSLNEAKKEV